MVTMVTLCVNRYFAMTYESYHERNGNFMVTYGNSYPNSKRYFQQNEDCGAKRRPDSTDL